MASLTSLNSFSNSSLSYQVDTQYVRGDEDDALLISPPSWAMVQTMGNVLTGTGITATYTMANAAAGVISFPTANTSANVVTTSNVTSGVYTASNIHSAEDWLASDAYLSTPLDFFGEVTLTLNVGIANSTGYTYSIPYNLYFNEKPLIINATDDVIYTANANTVLNLTQVCQIGNEAPLTDSYTFTIDTQDPVNVIRLYTTANATLTTNTFAPISNTTARLTLAGTGTNINEHLRSVVVQHSGVQRTPVIVNPSPSNLPLAPGYFNNAFSMAGFNSLNTTSLTVLNLLNNSVSCAELTFEGYLNISQAVFLTDPTYGQNYFNQILGSGFNTGGGGGPLLLRVFGTNNVYNTTGKIILALMGQQILWYEFAFNTPMHLAITRTTGNILRLYIDGQQITNTIVPPGSPPAPGPGEINGSQHAPTRFVMGHFSELSTTPNGLYGYMDEIRLSNTIRYTGASFVKPSLSFLNDANTVMLLHQDTGAADDGGGVTRSNAKVINAEDWRLTWTTSAPNSWPTNQATASYLQRYGQQRTGTFDLYTYTADNTTTVTTANLRTQYHIGDVTNTGNIMITAYSPLYYGNLANDQVDVTYSANSQSYSTIQFVSTTEGIPNIRTATVPMERIRSRDATLALPVPGYFTNRQSTPVNWFPSFYHNLTTTTSAFAVGGGQVDNFTGNIRWQYDDISTNTYVALAPFNGPIGGTTRRNQRWYVFGKHSNYEYWSMMYLWVTGLALRQGGTTVWSWGRGGTFAGTWPAGKNIGIQAARNFTNYPTFIGTQVLTISRSTVSGTLNFSAPQYIFSAITPGIDFETSPSGVGCYESAYSVVPFAPNNALAAFSDKPLFFNMTSAVNNSPAYQLDVTFGVFKYNGAGVRQVPIQGSELLGYPSQLFFTQTYPV